MNAPAALYSSFSLSVPLTTINSKVDLSFTVTLKAFWTAYPLKSFARFSVIAFGRSADLICTLVCAFAKTEMVRATIIIKAVFFILLCF